MSRISGRGLALLAIVAVLAAVAVVVLYREAVVENAGPLPETPTPSPLPSTTATSNSTWTPSMPAGSRDEVLGIALHDSLVRSILGLGRYSVSGVLPWTDERGNVIGGCVVVSFASPIWLELNASSPDGKPLEYIGWARHLTVCVNLSSKRVTGVIPSLGTGSVPGQLPGYASPKARMLAEGVLEAVKKFLLEKYGVREGEVNLTFYGVLNGVAVVVAASKTGDREILVKVDTGSMKVIEAYEYTSRHVSVSSSYVNATAES